MEITPGQLSETRFNKIKHVLETGSTNSDLILKASELPDGFLLIADHQLEGRGRKGRALGSFVRYVRALLAARLPSC